MLGAILGVGQALFGGISAANAAAAARREQRRLERQAANSPLQKASPELSQYYKQAQSRYQENPFTTPYYLETVKQADRAAVNALGAMQTRGGAIGSIGKINQGLMDAKNRGIAGAVQNKNAQFAQYGQAAQARAAEQNRLFNVNQQAPYERMLQLQQLKAQAANDRYSAGMSTIAQGLGNLAQYGIAKEMYGDNTKKLSLGERQKAANVASRSDFEADRLTFPKLTTGIPKTDALSRDPYIATAAPRKYNNIYGL